MSFQILHSRFPYMASHFVVVCACSGLLTIIILFERLFFWLSQGVAAVLIIYSSIRIWELFAQLRFSFSQDAIAKVDTWFLPLMYFGLGSWIAFVAIQVAAVGLKIVKKGND
ncbi:MAG: hypothetical protein IPM50_10590 [Acidobacteriota bacterium]|nr:MAG: hypothetical protein IPM50_10590 [Acidobacteriota bacterium]